MLLLSTSSLKGYGLHKIFVFAKKCGYDGINIDLDPANFDSWNKKYIKSLIDTFGVPVLSLTAPEKGVNKKKVDEIIDIAQFIGAQMITFSPPHITDRNPDWFTRYLSKAGKDNHITITVQNIEPKFLFLLIPEYRNNNLLDIKKTTGYTSLNISNIDKSQGTDVLRASQVLGNTLKNVYLSDKKGPKGGLLPGMAGGSISNLPLESFLMKLKTSSYIGYITLKVNPKELEAGDDVKVLENLKHAKEYYTKHFKSFDGK